MAKKSAAKSAGAGTAHGAEQMVQREVSHHVSSQSARRLAQLRKLSRLKFVQRTVSELGGKWQAGLERSRGFQGYIIVSPASHRALADDCLEKCRWYPVQVKQKVKVGRLDIDCFEAVIMREECDKGFFVAFDYSSDALTEIGRFFKQTGKVIVALTVREILEEEIARKLA